MSGEVSHWTNLAHRTAADLEAAGTTLCTNTTAMQIDAPGRRLIVRDRDGRAGSIRYDALVVGTGAISVRPPIAGLTGAAALGPADGVHLLHSMGDMFALMDTIVSREAKTAVVVGAGYRRRDGRRLDGPRMVGRRGARDLQAC